MTALFLNFFNLYDFSYCALFLFEHYAATFAIDFSITESLQVSAFSFNHLKIMVSVDLEIFYFMGKHTLLWIELIFLECDHSDASFGYPGGPILFRNLNFGIDLDSRVASKDNFLFLYFGFTVRIFEHS